MTGRRADRGDGLGGGDRPEMGIPCGYSIPFKVYLVYPLGACDVGCRAAAVRSTGAEERMFISSAGGPHTSLGYPSSDRLEELCEL